MKALRFHEYGDVNVLRYEEAPTPRRCASPTRWALTLQEQWSTTRAVAAEPPRRLRARDVRGTHQRRRTSRRGSRRGRHPAASTAIVPPPAQAVRLHRLHLRRRRPDRRVRGQGEHAQHGLPAAQHHPRLPQPRIRMARNSIRPRRLRSAAEITESRHCRIIALHLKDGPTHRGTSQPPLGTGDVNIPGVLAAANDSTWRVLEIDTNDLDRFDLLEANLTALTTDRARD